MTIYTSFIADTYTLPQDPKYIARDALSIYPELAENMPETQIVLGRNSGKSWDLTVHMGAKEYRDAQLLGRDIATAAENILESTANVHSVTPDSGECFEGQQAITRYAHSKEGLLALRRVHINNISDEALPKIAEAIFKKLGITGADLATANNTIGNYMNGVFDAEQMSHERRFSSVARNILGFLRGKGWKPFTPLNFTTERGRAAVSHFEPNL